MRTIVLAMGTVLALAAGPQGSSPTPTPTTPTSHLPGRRQPHDYVLLSPEAGDGAEMVGRRAMAWSFERWIRSPALTPQDLRGKVVLLRWWTDGCDFCRATLPGLETLRKRYADSGLVVIGAYHPKPPGHVGDKQVLAAADRLGFKGPIAVDERWKTLDRYWLAGHDREFTSVSFLIDRDGVIRWVHQGGEYHPSADPRHATCDAEYHGLEEVITKVLAEPGSSL